jgi:hypothetical protein
MSDGAPFIVLPECGGKIHIRCRRPYPQEFQLRLLEVPALVAEIVGVLPRDAHSIALIDQIMAAVRAHRPCDRTNAEKSLLKSVPPDSDGTDIVLRWGEVEICVNRGADVERLVSQLASRYWAIEPVIEQAEKIGSEIQRLPYADYIDEIAKTGVCCVVSYGDAFFVDGKLVHYPERQTLLLKAIEDGRTFAIV